MSTEVRNANLGEAAPATSEAPPPSPEITQAPEGTPEEGSPTPGETPPPPPAYVPNWKFKAAQQEHEIPEWARGGIKDAVTEKTAKEVFEKAFGFDSYKNRTETQIKHFQENIVPAYTELKQQADRVVKLRDLGDLDGVFEVLGIPFRNAAQWMLQKLEAQELPPQQRAVYENEQRLKRQNLEYEERLGHTSQAAEQALLQVKAIELNMALSKPEVQAVSEAYNARVGDPQAFWNFVCLQAQSMERSLGRNVSAQEAVGESLKYLGGMSAQSPAQPPPGVSPPTLVSGPNGPKTPPIIPNVGSRNTSPVAKQATSIAELRRLGKEMLGAS